MTASRKLTTSIHPILLLVLLHGITRADEFGSLPATTNNSPEAGEANVIRWTHPFGPLGALQELSNGTLVGKFSLTENDRAVEFYLYYTDSYERRIPNHVNIYAITEQNANTWKVERVYQTGRTRFELARVNDGVLEIRFANASATWLRIVDGKLTGIADSKERSRGEERIRRILTPRQSRDVPTLVP